MRNPPPIEPWVITQVDRVARDLSELAERFGRSLVVDAEEEICRRMYLTGWRPTGRVSAGGSCRLLRDAHGAWIALNLARTADVEALPAVFECDVPTASQDEMWGFVERKVADNAASEIVRRGIEFGIPVSVVGEAQCRDDDPSEPVTSNGDVPQDLSTLKVIDLSSLWAGPLVGKFLADLGCRVVKVESTRRPDGARSGHPEFFRSMNSKKEFRTIDFRSLAGRTELKRLIADADIVIESSRPRALDQLGIDRRRMLSDGPIRAWLSITAFGIQGESAMRVGFGDDAAAAGGLVRLTDEGPSFIGDAIADPITGLIGTKAVLSSLLNGQPTFLDVALSRSAAVVASAAPG